MKEADAIIKEKDVLIHELQATIERLHGKGKTDGGAWDTLKEHLLRILDRIEPTKAIAFGATTALVYMVLQNSKEVKKTIDTLAVAEVIGGGIVAVVGTLFAPGISQIIGLGMISAGIGTEIVQTEAGQITTALLGHEPDWEALANQKAKLQADLQADQDKLAKMQETTQPGYIGPGSGAPTHTSPVYSALMADVAKLQKEIAAIPNKPFITKKDALYIVSSIVIAFIIVEYGGDIIHAAGGIVNFFKDVLFAGVAV